MMPPPMAANDVSSLRSEMMQIAARSMMRCLPLMSRRTHHQRSGIMREAHIICPSGQTSLKKARFRVLFSGCGIGIRILACGLGQGAIWRAPGTPFNTRPFESRIFVQTKTKTGKARLCFGCGIGIRTPTNRVRVCRAAVTQFRKISATFHVADVILTPI